MRCRSICPSLAIVIVAVFVGVASAQPPGANYDESKVPDYTLPDPLAGVATPDEWARSRRGEILRLFRDEVYGWSPPRPTLGAPLREATSVAFDGMAVRRQIRVPLGPEESGLHLDLMLTLPAEAKEPMPVFLALCRLPVADKPAS